MVLADYYKEQLVTSAMEPKERIRKVAIGLIIIIAALLLTRNLMFTTIIVLILFFLDYKFTKIFASGFIDRSIEYEYIVTNSIFEADKVINKSSRAPIIDVDMKDIIFLGKLNNPKLTGYKHEAIVKDVSNIKNKNDDEKYTFIVTYKDKKTQVIFEPNEAVLELFKMFVPKHATEI